MMRKRILIPIGIVAGMILLALVAFLVFRMEKYTLELTGNGTITYEYGTDVDVKQQSVVYHGKIFFSKGISLPAQVNGTWNAKKLGSYDVTFEASFLGKSLTAKGTLKIVDTLPPKITLESDPKHYTQPHTAYEEEGYSAFDLYDGDVTDKVVREEKDGKVYYTVKDSSGNTATKVRKILYKDFVVPVITLTGGEEYAHQLGQPFTEPGFQAIDDYDGDVTANVSVTGTVDGMKAGKYNIHYEVSDIAGNVGKATRTVTVADYQPPVITLNGEKNLYLKVGTAYQESGYTATDNFDGNITSKVSVSGSVDTSKMGYNTLVYTVSDSSGLIATATRSVFVYEKQAISDSEHPGDKVVYLTFDDGPSKYTEGLLNTLDKYGVKATFFVTNQFPAYQHMIGEAHRRGHTIALHTYSHRYNELYASETAYYQDLANIEAVVKAQCPGFTPTIVRFPGGTNNTVSRKYCSEIMSVLSQAISYHGYLYCDWNVSSGDAGGTKNTNVIAQNVINGIKSRNVSVVLQHDISSYSTAAVDQIIFWGLANGYTFLPMTEKTPMVHFNPLN